MKRRAVGCFSMVLRRLLDVSACDPNLKPADREVCKIKECYPDARWRKGTWGKVMLQSYLNRFPFRSKSVYHYMEMIGNFICDLSATSVPHEVNFDAFI